jgi:hypothetical protein
MATIANEIGRAACWVLRSLVDRCHTGESVQLLGYFTGGLILVLAVFFAATRVRP